MSYLKVCLIETKPFYFGSSCSNKVILKQNIYKAKTHLLYVGEN